MVLYTRVNGAQLRDMKGQSVCLIGKLINVSPIYLLSLNHKHKILGLNSFFQFNFSKLQKLPSS